MVAFNEVGPCCGPRGLCLLGRRCSGCQKMTSMSGGKRARRHSLLAAHTPFLSQAHYTLNRRMTQPQGPVSLMYCAACCAHAEPGSRLSTFCHSAFASVVWGGVALLRASPNKRCISGE